MPEFKFKLMQRVTCGITGFSGIIVGRSEWITGTNTYEVAPHVINRNEMPDTVAIDECVLYAVGKEDEQN